MYSRMHMYNGEIPAAQRGMYLVLNNGTVVLSPACMPTLAKSYTRICV
jgi:hypothetical protein